MFHDAPPPPSYSSVLAALPSVTFPGLDVGGDTDVPIRNECSSVSVST